MSDDADFREVMVDTVTITDSSGSNRYRDPTASTSMPYTHVRVQYDTIDLIGPDGERITSGTQVIVMGWPAIGLEDRVTLPDGTTYPIQHIGKESDDVGPHHTVLYL